MPDGKNLNNASGSADLLTLDSVCAYCNNYFTRREWMYPGEYSIINGVLPDTGFLQTNQYYRIIGSIFNDGVHQVGNPDDILTDETFSGAIWAMAIPSAVIALAKEIDEWRGKYEDMLASPLSSESFGGYSYTKSGAAGVGTGGKTWQDIFRSKLMRWRKI